jgi:hypothetical protein
MRGLVYLILISVCWASEAAQKQASDVVDRLMPNMFVALLQLPKPSEREEAIKELKEAQRTARGFRAEQIALLLAVLNVDYEQNRDYLVGILKGCHPHEVFYRCDDTVSHYLVYLFQHGHREISAPLLDAIVRDDNASAADALARFFWSDVSRPSERADAAKRLKEARRTAYGSHAQQIAFLLAVLNVDYPRDRDYLLWALRGCDVPEIRNGCDELTGSYLVDLFQHGHREILAPLLNAAIKDYNAAGSEILGGFFSELVASSPEEFLDGVRSFPVPTQKKMCYFAGLGDGGGMGPSDLKELRARLGAMHDEVAQRCLLQIESANKH